MVKTKRALGEQIASVLGRVVVVKKSSLPCSGKEEISFQYHFVLQLWLDEFF